MKEHFANSELDLSTFDPAPFRRLVAQADARGYQFITMADRPSAVAQRELYALDMECTADEPDKGPDWEPIEYEAYVLDYLAPDRYHPKAVYVAIKDVPT